MAFAYPEALRNARLQEIIDAIDAGTGAGLLRFYDGTRPATGGTVTNLLVEIPLNDPSFGAPSAGVATANAISAVAATAAGTASWARIVDSDGNFVLDADVGTSGTDIVVTTTAFTVGLNIDVTGFTITEGNP